MSKFTLGQRQFPTLGLRSQQPKNYVGPTLSCYLGIKYTHGPTQRGERKIPYSLYLAHCALSCSQNAQ